MDLRELAAFLRSDRGAILSAWERLIRTISGSPSRRMSFLRDEMPGVLDHLASCLETGNSNPMQSLMTRAATRLEAGFELSDLAMDYRLLRRAILDRLSEAGPVSRSHERTRSIAILDEQLDLAAIAGIDTFIHEREGRIAAGRQRLQRILEVLPIAVWLADEDGVITWGNQVGKEIWGGLVRVGPGRYDVYRAWWPDGRRLRGDEWAVARAFESGEVCFDEEVHIEAFDGRRKVIRDWALPLADGQGRIEGAIVLAEDITERKRYEETRERFIGMLGHDLRDPLNAISMTAQVMMAAEDLPARYQECAARIARSTDRMSRLIRDLLYFTHARLGGGIPVERKTCDLNALLTQAVEETRAGHPERKVQLDVRDPLRASCDSGRIIQAVSNLLENAVKHGGDPIRLSVRRDDGHVVVEVYSAGPAIAEETATQLFEPFHREVPDERGLGLGLFIVREIAAAHGGEVFAHPEGRGNVFGFRIPGAPGGSTTTSRPSAG